MDKDETFPYVNPPIPSGFNELGTADALASLYAALAKAQAGFAPVHRSKSVTIQPREGRAYSFSYAPLEDLLAATRAALGTVGLSVITPIVRLDATAAAELKVIVAHEAGARLIASFAFTPAGDMKQMAGQWTYLRRYGYSSVLNLAADDDVDGEEPTASSRPSAQPASSTGLPPPPSTTTRPASNSQFQMATPTYPPGQEIVSLPTDQQREEYQTSLREAANLDIDLAPFAIDSTTTRKRLFELAGQLAEKKREKALATSPMS